MSLSDPVQEQYQRYSYPEPADDIPTWLQTFNYDPFHPTLYGALFWPEGRPRPDVSILSAGCGTMQAAVLAFQDPEAHVTGIDFSKTSIAHEEKLRERHNLRNLELRQMDLREVGTLGRSFDLIVCSGVLHHLADPSEGLRALASVLEPTHGVMILMLYARLGRTGVYALQDVFRRMRVPQTPEGVKLVRSVVRKLPPYHPGRLYFDNAPELVSDAAVVDTFLHPQDTAYSVPEILDFVRTNGLVFKGWLDRGLYHRDWPGVADDVADEDRWAITESLLGNMGTHNFMVSLPERDRRSEVDFDGDHWLDYVPHRHPQLRASEFVKNKVVRGADEYVLSDTEYNLLSGANGRRRISQILKNGTFPGMTPGQLRQTAKEFYRRMWRSGHIFCSLDRSRS